MPWSPDGWQRRVAEQQPDWPDEAALTQVVKALGRRPPLVFSGETRKLREQLAAVARGEAFLLQAGDCVESFDSFSTESIQAKLRVILQMAVVLTYSGGIPVVKVGRIAGQLAKPRSSPTETVDGTTLPSFRGHMVNDFAFEAEARRADPQRLLSAYDHAAGTLNLLRALTKGGYAGMSQVHAWNQAFVASSAQGERYEEIAAGIDRALAFMRACGVDLEAGGRLSQVDLFTSHEALLLHYEQALCHGEQGAHYGGSAHMLWIGERTRGPAGAHVDFLSGLANPIGVKLGPGASPEDALELCRRLDPEREPGRLTLISRMGADAVQARLPPLLRAVRDAGHPVVWACDPMHGNTYTSESGHKTRDFDAILREVSGFFAAHGEVGTWPGGLHVELTGEDVTECIGGEAAISEQQLQARYETMCDPRLNGRQSLDLAFRSAELLAERRS
ncbi:MAG: 3-deoxy-7-phosphoheptulonate synthase class II [Myxococcales bacterium]|nr:3-deoxy-7-phosphoheptulonate synthase class II [Myxococcales bacterium]